MSYVLRPKQLFDIIDVIFHFRLRVLLLSLRAVCLKMIPSLESHLSRFSQKLFDPEFKIAQVIFSAFPQTKRNNQRLWEDEKTVPVDKTFTFQVARQDYMLAIAGVLLLSAASKYE